MGRQGFVSALLACATLAVVPFLVAPASADAGYAKRTLKSGSKGKDVKLLQKYLSRAGFPVTADGHYGGRTLSAQRRFEASTARRVDGRASRAEQRLVRRAARSGAVRGVEAEGGAGTGGTKYEPPQGNPNERAVLGPDGRTAIAPDSAPQAVKDAIAAANKITSKPYRYGGGHGSFEDSGYDCSGAVSYALHGGGLLESPLDSSSFMSWGEAGRGDWITVYAHGGHAYVVIAGLRFDTSGGGQGEKGPRWRTESRSSRGFTARHPKGL